MKNLFAIGLIVVVLGVLALIVPIPHTDHTGFKAGGVSFGVETEHDQKVSPVVGGLVILAGAVLMVAGKSRS